MSIILTLASFWWKPYENLNGLQNEELWLAYKHNDGTSLDYSDGP